MGDYHIEDMYQGGYSSLNPNYNSLFTGYRIQANSLGTPSAPPGQQGDILTNLSKSISTGQKVVELSLLNPEIVDSIPKQHMKEVGKMAKLVGVDITVHGPLVEASGATDRGYDELQRELAEKKILQALERSHELDSKGNISVTFHTTNAAPGPIWKKEKDEKEEVLMMPVVNQETGQIGVVKKEEYYSPLINEKGEVEKETYDVSKRLKVLNNTEWQDSISKVEFHRENAERIIKDVHPIFIGKYLQQSLGDKSVSLKPEETEQVKKIYSAEAYIKEAERSVQTLFNKAYKYGDDKERDYLKEVSKQYSKILNIKDGRDTIESHNPKIQSEALLFLEQSLERLRPQIYKPAEEYTMQQSVQSFGNAAWESYKKFKGKSPVMNIENPPAGFGLSRAKDVKNMVEGAREQFVKRAVDKGMSKNDAKREAEKLIGATWDLGHINQLRKFGFSGKDIIKEAEIIKPYVKHVHLSDNFGAENTELPPGMGNVDFKEVMKKLGKKGKEAKKIVEAFHWVQSQKSSPYDVSLQALGSPLYGMSMAPYWNQVAGLQQGYFSYGMMLPQIHYETFRAGFSNLPAELGGQRQGGQGGRMSGNPME